MVNLRMACRAASSGYTGGGAEGWMIGGVFLEVKAFCCLFTAAARAIGSFKCFS